MQLNKNTRLGWIGTGVMGLSMCDHLIAAGYKITVYNRTSSKIRLLTDKGATPAASVSEVAENSEIIFTMVGYPADVEEVYLDDNGLLSSVKKESIVVDMTTTSPDLSAKIYNRAAALKVNAVDAPVSGGDIGAKNAMLSIMIGGDKQAVAGLMPLFKLLGQNIIHQGKAGSGQHTKMCNQIVIAGTMIGVCESLLYGYKAGLELNTMLDSIKSGAAACWALENLAPRILSRDFAAGFYVEHFIKDMAIALEESARMGLALPGLALVHQLYVALQAQGHGKKGTQALMLALEKISGIK